jgi:hypothetical protein
MLQNGNASPEVNSREFPAKPTPTAAALRSARTLRDRQIGPHSGASCEPGLRLQSIVELARARIRVPRGASFNRGGKPCAFLRLAPARRSGTSILLLIAGRPCAGSRCFQSASDTGSANPLRAAGCEASVIRCSSRSNAAGRFAVAACSPAVDPLIAVASVDAGALSTVAACFAAAVHFVAAGCAAAAVHLNAAGPLSADRFAAVAIAVTCSPAERVPSPQSKPFCWREPSRAFWRGCSRSIGRSSTATGCRRDWDCFSTPRSEAIVGTLTLPYPARLSSPKSIGMGASKRASC